MVSAPDPDAIGRRRRAHPSRHERFPHGNKPQHDRAGHGRTTGIGGNSQYEKEEDRIKDKLRGNKAETITETLHKAGWKTAAVNHFMLEGSCLLPALPLSRAKEKRYHNLNSYG